MVHIPAGKFVMGSEDQDPLARPNEKPQHVVDLSEYWISQYPITNKQYAQFLEAQFRSQTPLIDLKVHWNIEEFHNILTNRFNLEEIKTLCLIKLRIKYENIGGEGLDAKARDLILHLEHRERLQELQQIIIEERPILEKEIFNKMREHYKEQNKYIFQSSFENHPVVLINQKEANNYCVWLSNITGKHFRLPSEQEWEKAARGSFPNSNQFTWGDNSLTGACNTQETQDNTTTPVDHYESTNFSPYGVVDMLGNVWEWTSSAYKPYKNSSHESIHYRDERVVIRGGCWKYPARYARIPTRGRYEANTKNDYLGFRVVNI